AHGHNTRQRLLPDTWSWRPSVPRGRLRVIMSESNLPTTPAAVPVNQPVVGPINATLAAQLEALLAQRGPSTITSGFLAWFGDTQFPDGGANAPPLTQQAWQRYYYRLQTAAL